METFMRLYGNLIVFVYHCFDRIVINGYLSMLSRPENVFTSFTWLWVSRLGEVCSNNLSDFHLKKSLENLPAVRQVLGEVTDRYSAFQAQTLNVHVDFALFQRLAVPVVAGKSKVPGIKIHDTRMVRLMEVLLHSGRQMSAWRTAHIHQLITRTYNLKPYTLTQLRYDLRKLKARGLLERQDRRYL